MARSPQPMFSMLLPMLFCLAAGCSDDGKVALHGTVTWNGQPVERGYIELQPVDATGQFASAQIVDGQFSLRATPGPRRVKVTAERQIGERPPNERIPKPEPIWFQYIPAKFNTNSDLEIEIQPGDPTLEIDLEGDERTPGEMTAAERKRKAMQGGGRD